MNNSNTMLENGLLAASSFDIFVFSIQLTKTNFQYRICWGLDSNWCWKRPLPILTEPQPLPCNAMLYITLIYTNPECSYQIRIIFMITLRHLQFMLWIPIWDSNSIPSNHASCLQNSLIMSNLLMSFNFPANPQTFHSTALPSRLVLDLVS